MTTPKFTPPNTEITPSRHTPGEWYFDHDSDGDFAIFGGETGNKLLAVTNSDTPEDEANAAAPDMLSALKAAVADRIDDEWLKNARKIIRKAEKQP